MMHPQGDGRTYVCDYCKTQVLVAVEGHQIAAGMHLDLSNIEGFLGQLANTLHAGYGECTRITAQGTYVHAIEVTVEPDGFLVHREGAGVVAQHKKMVRGVALKTSPHPVDVWVGLLHKAIATHVNTNAKAAAALAQLRIT